MRNIMNNLHKRFALFLIGCMGARLLLVFAARNISVDYLPYMGYAALAIAIGFAYIYLTGSRKTGGEVFGEQIWWNDLRPVHSALYFIFALYAINRQTFAWIYLAMDVVIGLVAFLLFHWSNGDIARIIG